MREIRDYRTSTGDTLPGGVTDDGQVRLFGYVPSGRGMYAAPRLSTAVPLIDQKDWLAFDRRRKSVPMLNQGGLGSCNPHGATSTVMNVRDAAGMTFQLLSPCFLYAQIDGGRDGGSDPSDAMTTIQSVGVCLESEVTEGHYRKRDVPASAYETAKRFRVSEGEFYSIDTFEELVTAAVLGWHYFHTVKAGGAWMRGTGVDKDGCAPVLRGQGNHVTCGGEALKQLSTGEWVLPHRNSWQPWGYDGGYYNFRRAHLESQSGWQAYAIKAATVDPLDPCNPPVAK